MRFDLTADVTNVIRFPLERRDSLAVLHHIAPDAREVGLLAETYDVALPPDLQDRADRDAAEHILNHAAVEGPARADLLREMVAGAVTTAIAAVRRAHALAEAACAARRALAAAHPGMGHGLLELQERAAERAHAAAEALVVAHGHAQEAFGVARVVDLARRGVPWAPRDHHVEMEALLALKARRRVR